MGTIRQYNKAADTVYVYDVTYYYDPSKKRTCSRKKLIGKVDKQTGEVVPTGNRGRPRKEIKCDKKQERPAVEEKSLQQMQEREKEYQHTIAGLKREVARLNTILDTVRRLIG